ncbi:MAG: SsrA-binding protein SmpB [Ruminococcaceae bacterium]|nr:SsrA-binding protein SmpB [Oscillospiraceae bacterium]
MASTSKKLIAQNKKARHDYFVDDTFEAGIELCGTEVKSLRSGAVNLKDSFCRFKDGELFAMGIHISPYEQGNIFNKDPRRDRKLLLHRKELDRLFGAVNKKGFSIIPLSFYFSGKWVKVELGLCRGKKLYDKREADAKRTMEMEARRSNVD